MTSRLSPNTFTYNGTLGVSIAGISFYLTLIVLLSAVLLILPWRLAILSNHISAYYYRTALPKRINCISGDNSAFRNNLSFRLRYNDILTQSER